MATIQAIMEKTTEVKKIIQYLDGKTASLRSKIEAYNSPIMQAIIKDNIHLQYDYTRLQSQLEAYEDILLAITQFTSGEETPKVPKVKAAVPQKNNVKPNNDEKAEKR